MLHSSSLNHTVKVLIKVLSTVTFCQCFLFLLFKMEHSIALMFASAYCSITALQSGDSKVPSVFSFWECFSFFGILFMLSICYHLAQRIFNKRSVHIISESKLRVLIGKGAVKISQEPGSWLPVIRKMHECVL